MRVTRWMPTIGPSLSKSCYGKPPNGSRLSCGAGASAPPCGICGLAHKRSLPLKDRPVSFKRLLGRWPKPAGALGWRRDTSRLLRSGTMIVHRVTPILTVSDMDASFAWFAKLGWKELWRGGGPTGFGAVGSGPCEIFMCRGGQGGRGKGKNTSTFASFEDETQDKGCWMSWWVEDVDALYGRCGKHGIEVTWRPTDMPWNVREMHVRHPDGHVFRIGKGLKEEQSVSASHWTWRSPGYVVCPTGSRLNARGS